MNCKSRGRSRGLAYVRTTATHPDEFNGEFVKNTLTRLGVPIIISPTGSQISLRPDSAGFPRFRRRNWQKAFREFNMVFRSARAFVRRCFILREERHGPPHTTGPP
jgi:hypothetical protein